jgi:xanthine dehydrogenase YagR molybdenum-binding subunit
VTVTEAHRRTGEGIPRVDGVEKVTGRARYAFEHGTDGVAFAAAVPATIAKGRITVIDDTWARSLPGVLEVITPENAPHLPGREDPELALFQSHNVAYRGQFVAAVVATTLEVAREAAEVVHVEYEATEHDVSLRRDHAGLYKPDKVNPNFETDTAVGDFDAAFTAALVQVDQVYTTPGEHNHPMEPHATTAEWAGGRLTLIDSVQGTLRARAAIAALFGLDIADVRILCQHVGGGFGAKGTSRPQCVVAAIAAKMVGRPVKCATTRQQMFATTGYRTPSIQRVQLGAGPDGRLRAIAHDVWEQTSTIKEFAEQTAVATRHMYAAPHRRTTHRVVALDVPTPAWMRAPGECPGMFALESAMDELAIACGVDPVELRVRNEPERDPESGLSFSSRNLVACLREGAARFGWTDRDPRPRTRRDGRWLVGTGVASSMYPARAMGSSARITALADGRFLVEIDATDIGTGARTALTVFAADALAVDVEDIVLRIGDSDLPQAMIAGGSMGTASWTWAIGKAAADLRSKLAEHAGPAPAGLSVEASTAQDVERQPERARFAFGAQFAEARVDVDTGEVRVPRLLGVFAAGRIVNPVTARSQLVGGMTMGLSMALFEESHIDPEFGDVPTHDLAQYHVATNADVDRIEAHWIEEDEAELGYAGAKGIGEIGIVGTAAAIANAVHHATGVRIRDLPIRLDKLLA